MPIAIDVTTADIIGAIMFAEMEDEKVFKNIHSNTRNSPIKMATNASVARTPITEGIVFTLNSASNLMSRMSKGKVNARMKQNRAANSNTIVLTGGKFSNESAGNKTVT